MPQDQIHYGDIGTIFMCTVMDGSTAVDISASTVRQLTFRKPSGTTITRNAVLVAGGTDGRMSYTTVSGDLDETGWWLLQGLITIPSGTWRSDWKEFEVFANL